MKIISSGLVLTIVLSLTAGGVFPARTKAALPAEEFIDEDSQGSDDAGSLQDRRQQAKERCEADSAGGNLFFGQGTAGSMQNSLAGGFNDNLPSITSGILNDNFSSAFTSPSGPLRNAVSQNVNRGIQTRLPVELGRRIGQARNGGMADDEIRANIDGWVDEILGGIFNNAVNRTANDQFQGIVTETLQGVFNQFLPPELRGLVDEILGGGDLFNQFSDILSPFSGPGVNIDGIAQDLLNNTSGAVQGSINNQSVGRLSNSLGGSLAGPFTSFLNPNQLLNPITGALNSSLGNISSAFLGPVNSAIGSFSDIINAPINAITSSVTNAINGVTGNITNAISSAITAPIQGLTSSLTGPLNSFTGSLTSGLGSVFNSSGINSAVNGVAGQASQAALNSAGPITSGALAGTPLASDPLANQTLPPGVESVLGGPSQGTMPASLAVPVHEVGELLTVTKTIDQSTQNIDQTTSDIKTLTEEIKEIQIQACTHLKVIRDLQLVTEEQKRNFNREAKKRSYSVVDDFFKFWRENFVRQGRAASPINTTGAAAGQTEVDRQPTINYNQTANVRNVYQEEAEKNIALLRQSENPHKSEVEELLRRINDDSANPYQSTISADDYRRFTTESENMATDDYRRVRDAIISNPINTPDGLFLAAHERQLVTQRVAAQQETNEFIASGGWHGIRQCLTWLIGGNVCAAWKTIVPASFVRFITEKFAAKQIDQLGDVSEQGEDFTGQEELLRRQQAVLSNLLEEPEDGLGGEDRGEDPCPGPGPCPDTGWEGAGATVTNLTPPQFHLNNLNFGFGEAVQSGPAGNQNRLIQFLIGLLADILSGLDLGQITQFVIGLIQGMQNENAPADDDESGWRTLLRGIVESSFTDAGLNVDENVVNDVVEELMGLFPSAPASP